MADKKRLLKWLVERSKMVWALFHHKSKPRALKRHDAQSLHEWFKELCEKLGPEWDAAIEEALEEQAKLPMPDRASRRDVEAYVADNARTDLARLDFEINQMLVRTTILVAAATLLFAVYALKSSVKAPAILLALALCFTAVAFITALLPMAPPFFRAWRSPYEKRHEWTLLATSPFKRWALDCWLSDRRTPVITKYKKAHSVAVRVLVIAAAVSAVGLTMGVFTK